MKNLQISLPSVLFGAVIAFACTVGAGKDDTASAGGNGGSDAGDDTASPPPPGTTGRSRVVLQVALEHGFSDAGVFWWNKVRGDYYDDLEFCGGPVELTNHVGYSTHGWDLSACCPTGFSPAGSPNTDSLRLLWDPQEGRYIEVPAVINCLED